MFDLSILQLIGAVITIAGTFFAVGNFALFGQFSRTLYAASVASLGVMVFSLIESPFVGAGFIILAIAFAVWARLSTDQTPKADQT